MAIVRKKKSIINKNKNKSNSRNGYSMRGGSGPPKLPKATAMVSQIDSKNKKTLGQNVKTGISRTRRAVGATVSGVTTGAVSLGARTVIGTGKQAYQAGKAIGQSLDLRKERRELNQKLGLKTSFFNRIGTKFRGTSLGKKLSFKPASVNSIKRVENAAAVDTFRKSVETHKKMVNKSASELAKKEAKLGTVGATSVQGIKLAAEIDAKKAEIAKAKQKELLNKLDAANKLGLNTTQTEVMGQISTVKDLRKALIEKKSKEQEDDLKKQIDNINTKTLTTQVQQDAEKARIIKEFGKKTDIRALSRSINKKAAAYNATKQKSIFFKPSLIGNTLKKVGENSITAAKSSMENQKGSFLSSTAKLVFSPLTSAAKTLKNTSLSELASSEKGRGILNYFSSTAKLAKRAEEDALNIEKVKSEFETSKTAFDTELSTKKASLTVPGAQKLAATIEKLKTQKDSLTTLNDEIRTLQSSTDPADKALLLAKLNEGQQLRIDINKNEIDYKDKLNILPESAEKKTVTEMFSNLQNLSSKQQEINGMQTLKNKTEKVLEATGVRDNNLISSLKTPSPEDAAFLKKVKTNIDIEKLELDTRNPNKLDDIIAMKEKIIKAYRTGGTAGVTEFGIANSADYDKLIKILDAHINLAISVPLLPRPTSTKPSL